MCSSIFGMNDVNERPPRRSVAAISDVVTDVNDVTAVYAVDALVCGSSAGGRLCPDVARPPAPGRPTTMGPLTFPAPDLAQLCRFFRTSSARQPDRLIAHVDHMRPTSIPSNHGTFTNHLHISRQFDRAIRWGLATSAIVGARVDPARARWLRACRSSR
jgi:hypothetical protein